MSSAVHMRSAPTRRPTGIVPLLVLAIALTLPSQSAHGQTPSDSETAPSEPPRAEIVGTIIDAETGGPLPGAHVFLSNTMIGTTTDRDGTFRLKNVYAGVQDVQITMVGYVTQQRRVVLSPGEVRRIDARVEPDVMAMDEVVVEAERNKAWRKNLTTFRDLLLGESRWADDCIIENPEVLSFDDSYIRGFRATASQPIIVRNEALGYEITVRLERFEEERGELLSSTSRLFRQLEPSSDAEARRWERNRERAYNGSMRHFFRSLIQDRVAEEGFRMYLSKSLKDLRPVLRADLIQQQVKDGYQLRFDDTLSVFYTREPESPEYVDWLGAKRTPRAKQESTLIMRQDKVVIDRNGRVINSYALDIYQYFSYERLANLVPVEYTPGNEPVILGYYASTLAVHE